VNRVLASLHGEGHMKLGLQSTGLPTKERLRKLPVNYYGPIPRLNSVVVLIFFGMFNDWTQKETSLKLQRIKNIRKQTV